MRLYHQSNTGEVVKPVVDKLKYRCMTLDNAIRITLISDPEADKAAAAMDQPLYALVQVRVGSLGDPDDLPGLAHFTEHMLFYASEKYPQEDEYSKFVVSLASAVNRVSLISKPVQATDAPTLLMLPSPQ
ncbi:hypothetical protein MMC14_009142 [Varicellaria rhodocarpa]|nr:hypothetical protein [Varicellaria rhodocarpa]